MLRSCPPRTSPVRHSVRRPSRAPVSTALRPAIPLPATARSNSPAMPPSLFRRKKRKRSTKQMAKIGQGKSGPLDRFSLQHRVDHAERVARVMVLRVDREIALIRLGGVFHPLELDVDEAHAGDRAERPRLELQRAVDVVERFLVRAHEVIERGAPVPALGEIGPFLDDAVEGLQRLRIVPLPPLPLALRHSPVAFRLARLDPDRPDLGFDLGRGVAVGRRLQLIEQTGQARILLVGLCRVGNRDAGEKSETEDDPLHAVTLTRGHAARHNDGVMGEKTWSRGGMGKNLNHQGAKTPRSTEKKVPVRWKPESIVIADGTSARWTPAFAGWEFLLGALVPWW